MLSSEEFVACLISRGFAVADMDKFSFGQLINYVYDYDRMQRRAQGEDVPDLDARYRQLKAAAPVIEQRYKTGQISKEQYDSYRAAMLEYEG